MLVNWCTNPLLFTSLQSNASYDIYVVLNPWDKILHGFINYIYKPFMTLIVLATLLIDIPPMDSLSFLVIIISIGLLESNLQSNVLPHKQKIAHSPLPLQIFTGTDKFYVIFMFHFKSSTTLWCDNVLAISQVHNLVFHARTEHIEIDYHFFQTFICYISSNDQLVDLQTKSLSSTTLLQLRDKLLTHFESSIWGRILEDIFQNHNPLHNLLLNFCPLFLPKLYIWLYPNLFIFNIILYCIFIPNHCKKK